MKKKTKCLAAAAILAGGLLAAAIYTRPRTIAQRYPFLDLDQCIQIHGYYSEGIQAEDTRFLITPEDPHFKEALRLFGSPAFRTKLGNLLPAEQKPTDTAKVISSGSSCSGLNLFFFPPKIREPEIFSM